MLGSMRDRALIDQRGFTLIELMIVVGILAILAAVVVPTFMSEARKGKYDPEISAMFTEISTKEEAYKSEISAGVYLAAATCPASPSQAGVDFAATCGGAWATLRVAPTDKVIRCTYAVTEGAGGTVPAPPAGFTMATPAGGWYFIVATCDMANDGGTNATFFQSSIDTKVQKQNYGQ
jgi:prepilin-type N-terminal cleavage/methylation domain-containing protein